MTEWKFAQRDPDDGLAIIHHFCINKLQDGREIEFIITVREYATPRQPGMLFFAQANREVNQKTAPYTPSGWGKTLLEALGSCIDAIRQFRVEDAESA